MKKITLHLNQNQSFELIQNCNSNLLEINADMELSSSPEEMKTNFERLFTLTQLALDVAEEAIKQNE